MCSSISADVHKYVNFSVGYTYGAVSEVSENYIGQTVLRTGNGPLLKALDEGETGRGRHSVPDGEWKAAGVRQRIFKAGVRGEPILCESIW